MFSIVMVATLTLMCIKLCYTQKNYQNKENNIQYKRDVFFSKTILYFQQCKCSHSKTVVGQCDQFGYWAKIIVTWIFAKTSKDS